MRKARTENSSLEMRVHTEQDGTCLFACTGEIDIRSASGFGSRLDAAARATPRRLVLDLSGVTYMDSAGIGQIRSVRQRLGGTTELQVRAHDRRILLLLAMAGLPLLGA